MGGPTHQAYLLHADIASEVIAFVFLVQRRSYPSSPIQDDTDLPKLIHTENIKHKPQLV